MQNNGFLNIWLLSVNFENFTSYTFIWAPLAVECLQHCDCSLDKFIEVKFSKLTESNQIFRNDLNSIHYHFCKTPGEETQCFIYVVKNSL